MKCTYCSGKTEVINSRPQKRSNTVWRRRHCLDCQAIFTTVERLDPSGAFRVMKDKEVTEYKSTKLLVSLYEALKHRTDASEVAESLANTVYDKLCQSGNQIWTVEKIKITTYETLRLYDTTAAEVYKAVHSN